MVDETPTEPPAKIVEAERLAARDGDALPTETEIASECDSEPLVPLTVTVKFPLAEDEQDRVEVPEPVRLVRENVHESPVDGDTPAVRLTTPANPLTPVTVTIEVMAVLITALTVVGTVVIVKSWPMYETVAE